MIQRIKNILFFSNPNFTLNWKLIIISLFFLFQTSEIKAQGKPSSADRAKLIIKITKGYIWDSHAIKDNFTLFILGSDAQLVAELKKTISIHAALFVVNSGNKLPQNLPNVIFLTKEKKAEISKVYKTINQKPVLLISEGVRQEEYIMVNLHTKNGRLDFTVNEFNSFKQGLKINKTMLDITNRQIDLPKIFNTLLRKLQTTKAELSDKIDELEMKEFDIKLQKKKLNANKKKVLMQEMALTSQQEGLVMFQSEINDKEEKLTQKEITLQNNIYLLENQKIILAQKEYLIQIKEEENKKQKAELDKQKAELQVQINTIKNQSKTIDTQDGRIEWQRYLIFGAIGSLILFAFLLFFIFRSYRIKQKINKELEDKQNEITQQAEELKTTNNALSEKKNILEERNSEIQASLNYALTIQQSILPIDSFLATKFDYFYIYKPKDIVSGDFYWYADVDEKGHKYKFIAVSDCTGHGVPGAFMSLIGSRILNEILEKEIYNTKQILEHLHKEITIALKQDETDNSDGMDITLVRIEDTKEGAKIQFTAAKHSLFIYHKGRKEIEKIRGDQKGIGGNYYDHVDFTSNELSLLKGDILYMLSDGIPDQCSLARKKFRGTGMVTMLKKASKLPFAEQKKCLENDLQRFMTYEEQIDDLTLFSIKL